MRLTDLPLLWTIGILMFGAAQISAGMPWYARFAISAVTIICWFILRDKKVIT